MLRLFRLVFWIIVILVIFAVVPDAFWLKLKPFFNWEKFTETLELGFQKFLNLFKGSTGMDLPQVGEKAKTTLGIDFFYIWQSIKEFLQTTFSRINNFFRS